MIFRRKQTVERAHTAALNDEERAHIQEKLAENEERIVDLATRLVRLEAEVGIYRPLFIHDEKGSQ